MNSQGFATDFAWKKYEEHEGYESSVVIYTNSLVYMDVILKRAECPKTHTKYQSYYIKYDDVPNNSTLD